MVHRDGTRYKQTWLKSDQNGIEIIIEPLRDQSFLLVKIRPKWD